MPIPHKQPTPSPKAPRPPKKQPQPALPPATTLDMPDVSMGLSGIEQELASLARAVGGYVHNATLGENSLQLFSGNNGYPVKMAFTDADGELDGTERLVTAIERIADSVAKLAGLNRPRLESWHEQCEYKPRYKDIAVDG